MTPTATNTTTTCSMDPVTMIMTKRQNERPHTDEELEWWIDSYVKNQIPDYQMSSWLMAVCWRGLNEQETATLTRCMVQSGIRVDWEEIVMKNNNNISDNNKNKKMILADKHSSGGVGDKISLILAPLVACLGVHVPMMAGRGLGHTGGTIDKLESIPGYATSLSVQQFQDVVSTVGCSIVGADKALCPADRKLYALRDVTGTVSSIWLQTASIMSKKIAENPHFLVLDTKYGRASFQDNVEDAIVLAHSMVATGEANGVQTTAFLTRMDRPLGRAVGNWLEIYECLQMMKTGTGPCDLMTLVVVQAAQMIRPKYPEETWDNLVEKALAMLKSGKTYQKFREMVQAQGGDVRVLDECPPNTAKFTKDIRAPIQGYVADINALIVGQACVKLGAGRTKAEDGVDFSAGIWWHTKAGESVAEGQTVATLYTNLSEALLEEQTTAVQKAIEYSETKVNIPPIISHFVSKGGHMEDFTIPSCLANL